MSNILDPNAIRTALVTLSTAQCTWAKFQKALPPGLITSAPGSLPLGVWRIDAHSVTHRESGSTGNQPGRPNKYTCYYIEQPSATAGQTLTIDELEDRIVNTYVAIAQGIVTLDDRDDNLPGWGVPVVSLEYDSRKGPYIEYNLQNWVGARICLTLEERYE